VVTAAGARHAGRTGRAGDLHRVGATAAAGGVSVAAGRVSVAAGGFRAARGDREKERGAPHARVGVLAGGRERAPGGGVRREQGKGTARSLELEAARAGGSQQPAQRGAGIEAPERLDGRDAHAPVEPAIADGPAQRQDGGRRVGLAGERARGRPAHGPRLAAVAEDARERPLGRPAATVPEQVGRQGPDVRVRVLQRGDELGGRVVGAGRFTRPDRVDRRDRVDPGHRDRHGPCRCGIRHRGIRRRGNRRRLERSA
jgi:hypothetical protein